MDCSVGDEGPAILQLHKWGPSQFQFNLSEFREAFISPTRELLLLLSYQSEALLFPLITGEYSYLVSVSSRLSLSDYSCLVPRVPVHVCLSSFGYVGLLF